MTINPIFVDRQDEISYLNREYESSGFKFISIIGRRRVGKTRLIEEFIKDKKNILYFFIQELDDRELRLSLTERMHREFGASFLGVPSWDAIFSELFKISEKSRIIVVFDEFQRFQKINRSVPSILQEFIDRHGRASSLFLIVMGSSIGMMHRLFDHASALYGRRTGQLDIQPIRSFYIKDWFPDIAAEKIIEIYSIFGGTPKYLEDIDPSQAIMENIENAILSKKSPLYSEPEILIKTELSDSATYFNILKLISEGKTRPAEIAESLTIKQTSIGYFLNVLENDLDLIKREVAVTEKDAVRSKKAIYRMKDSFFRFWFRYVHSNKSDIEINNMSPVIEKIKMELNSFIGHSFEDICKELLLKMNKTQDLPFCFSKIGSWWGFYRDEGSRKELEIDIAALNNETKEILFVECKWRDNVDASKILSLLKEKAKYVEWNTGKRTEYYAIFAKSFMERVHEAMLFDLKDIEKILQ